MEPRLRQPALAGLGIALIGYTSSFAVVLAGLRSVGATPAQATSGLIVCCVTTGIGTLWLSLRHRLPITLAWSTPGAAVLVSSGRVAGGWPAAVGAFVVVGALMALTGCWSRLGALIRSIPAPIAQAMLAGVLLEICLVPVRAVAVRPLEILPIVAVWMAAMRLAPRWAVPCAFGAMLVVVGVLAAGHGVHGPVLPRLSATAPRLRPAAVIGIALPLYVVTMAGQNVPGVAIMRSFGYEIPWREALSITGLATVLGAAAGGFASNLAAISASVPASPAAHADPARRWPAASAFGATFLVLGALSAALTTYLGAAPARVVATIAALGLLATLGSSLHAAFAEPADRVGAAIAFVVAAAGVTIAGLPAPAWALAAGILVRIALRREVGRGPH